MEEFTDLTENLHSGELQDIIGKPPMWLYRWGICLILSVILIGLCISVFITYPETVETKIKMHIISSTSTIYNNDSARLTTLYIQSGVMVKRGQHLADIRTANGIATITAPQNGKITYAGIVHESELLAPRQPIFYITGSIDGLYGEMLIPQNSFKKIKPGQNVLVNLKDYSDSQEMLTGTISYVTIDPVKENISLAEVDFNKSYKYNNASFMKEGLIVDAAVVTAKMTLFRRLISGMMMKGKNK